MDNSFNHYNKNLKPFARKLRNKSTDAEIKLWMRLLRNKQLLGYPFLRQRPICNYIADFFCKELKLVIEVDGGYHLMRSDADRLRDETLKAAGYTTLRFTNDEVIYNTDAVRETLENWIKLNKRRF